MKSIAILIAAALISFAADAHAQPAAGEINGIVVDQTGAALPDVSLTIINTQTGARRELRTDRDGRFTVPGLRVGTYDVSAARKGFAIRRQESLPVQIGRTSWVRLELTLAAEPETITVADLPRVIEPPRPHPAGLIDAASIDNLPVDGRHVLDLALSLPGVTRDVQAGQVLIAGNEAALNRVLVDGADAITFWPPLGASASSAPYSVSPDAVQEFRVDLNGYRAEYGSAGSVVHVVTKSGTNQAHGVASTFHGTPAPGAPRSRRSNQFAGTVGGPIVRDRHFFLVNADALRTTQPVTRDQNLFLVSTDHQFTDAQRVMVRFNNQGSNPSTRSFGSALTSVFRPSLVNDVRMYRGRGRLVTGPELSIDRMQAADTLTLIAGAHEVKTGFETRFDETLVRDVRTTSTFIQDEWQAMPAVTLNVGLRHDRQPVSRWNPRLGATWLPVGRLIIRGSYGLFSGGAPWLAAALPTQLEARNLRMRQAGGGVEWEWMPQVTLAANYLDSDSDVRRYRAVTAEMHRRFWRGMQTRLAYTFSTLTNADGTRAREDHRHRIVPSFVYSTDKLADRFHGPIASLVSDWTISGVLTAQSGRAPILPYRSIDPRIARNINLGGNRALSIIWEASDLLNRPNYLVLATPLALQESPIESRLTQLALRFSF